MLIQEFLDIYEHKNEIENIVRSIKLDNLKTFSRTILDVVDKLRKIINVRFTKRLESYFEKTFSLFIEKNTKLDKLEVSGLISQAYKIVLSSFDTVHKITELYPLTILCIIYLILKYKINNPEKPITKRLILKATKLFTYEMNMLWSKYKAKGEYEKRMHVLIVPFVSSYLLLLLARMSTTFAVQIYKIYGNSFEPLKSMYLLWTALLLVESIEMSEEYLQHLA